MSEKTLEVHRLGDHVFHDPAPPPHPPSGTHHANPPENPGVEARADTGEHVAVLTEPAPETGAQIAWADISKCGLYRYALGRLWDDGKALAHFHMLNPSTADATADDPTIRKCIGFARIWGFGGIYVTNLFAFRATDPRDLLSARDPVGPRNNGWFWSPHRGDDVVCAWGAGKTAALQRLIDQRAKAFVKEAAEAGGPRLVCLGRAKNRSPRHPLMLAYTARREAFSLTTAQGAQDE